MNRATRFSLDERSVAKTTRQLTIPRTKMASIRNTMIKLIRYQQYTRQDVHDIFSPIRRSLLRLARGVYRVSFKFRVVHADFVFFVTFGQKQAHHVFDEGITTDGVLTWQSQPSQRLLDRQIQQFINHNEDANSIYLFLRTAQGKNYAYLGKLNTWRMIANENNPFIFSGRFSIGIFPGRYWTKSTGNWNPASQKRPLLLKQVNRN